MAEFAEITSLIRPSWTTDTRSCEFPNGKTFRQNEPGKRGKTNVDKR